MANIRHDAHSGGIIFDLTPDEKLLKENTDKVNELAIELSKKNEELDKKMEKLDDLIRKASKTK